MFDSSAGRTKSRGSVSLALSLALNLFLLGWAATEHFGASDYAKPDPAPEAVAGTIAADLPSADSDILRRALAEKRQVLDQARQRYLAAFDRLRQVIGADVLDQVAFNDALGEMRRSRQAERQIFGDMMADVITRMSPQGRQAFVKTHMGGRP